MKNFTLLLLCFIVALCACADDKEFKSVNVDKEGVAVRGYDVVAYFTMKKAVQGRKDLSHKWNGAVWHFASRDNKEMFVKNPQNYVPQYGGYCAWAVSQNYTYDADPNAWKVVEHKDGTRRLYLNYNKDVSVHWQKEMLKNITSANKNWPKMLDKAKKE